MGCSKYPKHRAYPSFEWWHNKDLSRKDDMKGGKLESIFGAGPMHMPYNLLYGEMSFVGTEPALTLRSPMYGNTAGEDQAGATWANLGECGQPGNSATSNNGYPPTSWICGPCAYWKWSAFYNDELQCLVYERNQIAENDDGDLIFNDNIPQLAGDGLAELGEEEIEVEGVYPPECVNKEQKDIFKPGGPDMPGDGYGGVTFMSLHQPHFSSWITTRNSRMQFKDTGGVPGTPVSFYLVPGQPKPKNDLNNPIENCNGNKFKNSWDALWDFEDKSGSACTAWCSDTIFVGAVPCQKDYGCSTVVIRPHSPTDLISSEAVARGLKPSCIDCPPITSCCKESICSSIGPKKSRPVPYWEFAFEQFVEFELCKKVNCYDSDVCTEFPVPKAKSQASVGLTPRNLESPSTSFECVYQEPINLQKGLEENRNWDSPFSDNDSNGQGQFGGNDPESDWPGFCGDRTNPDGPCYECSPQSKFNNLDPNWSEYPFEGDSGTEENIKTKLPIAEPVGQFQTVNKVHKELCTDNRCPGCFGMYADLLSVDQLSGDLRGWDSDGKYKVCSRHSSLWGPVPMNSTCDLGSTAVLALEILGDDPCNFSFCESYIEPPGDSTSQSILSCKEDKFQYRMNSNSVTLDTPRTTDNRYHHFSFKKHKPCPVPVLPSEGDVLFLKQHPQPECGVGVMCKWTFGKEEQDAGWWSTNAKVVEDVTDAEAISWLKNKANGQQLNNINNRLRNNGKDPEKSEGNDGEGWDNFFGSQCAPVPGLEDPDNNMDPPSKDEYLAEVKVEMLAAGAKKCGKDISNKCAIPKDSAVKNMCYGEKPPPVPQNEPKSGTPNTSNDGRNHSGGNDGVQFKEPDSESVPIDKDDTGQGGFWRAPEGEEGSAWSGRINADGSPVIHDEDPLTGQITTP